MNEFELLQKIDRLKEKNAKLRGELTSNNAVIKELEREHYLNFAIHKKIRDYEARYKKERLEWSIHGLVLKDETYDQYWERHLCRTSGGSKEGKEAYSIKRYYKDLGTSVYSPYIKWLLELDDPRVTNTELYEKKKAVEGCEISAVPTVTSC